MGQLVKRMTTEAHTPEDLVIKYRKYVHSVAAKLVANMHLPATQLDEFISAGYLGLVEAAQRFNPLNGVDFKNFAFLRIRGSIIDSIRANSDLSGKSYRMAKAWAASQAIEETYFLDAVQKNAKNDQQALAEVFEFAASGALAFKLSMEDVEEEVADLICQDLSQEDKLIELQNSLSLKSLIFQLPEKEKIIIWSYYFENKTFSEIENENEGMTKSWVSRLHVRALSHLKELILNQRGGCLETL